LRCAIERRRSPTSPTPPAGSISTRSTAFSSLARKRPSPVGRGDTRIWAAGAIYAVGRVNFLFDRTQTPHLTAEQLAEALGVVKTTMANKAGLINRILDIGIFEPDLTRVAMIEQHRGEELLERFRSQLRQVHVSSLDGRHHVPLTSGRGAAARVGPRALRRRAVDS
jgi:hypothetical protein